MIKRVNYSLDRATIASDILITHSDLFRNAERLVIIADIKEDLMFSYHKGDVNIGFISLITHNYHCIEVKMIGIRKEDTNKGIGKSLINEAIDYARKNEFKVIEVKVNPQNKVRKFFEHLGFIPVEIINDKQIYILKV